MSDRFRNWLRSQLRSDSRKRRALPHSAAAAVDLLEQRVQLSATFPETTNIVAPESSDATGDISALAATISTTTSITVSPTAAVFGQVVTLKATVSSGSGLPTGSVTFRSGSKSIGNASIRTVGGKAVATLTTSALNVGQQSLVADYNGSTRFRSSRSTARTINVSQASTSVTATASLNSAVFGQAISLKATISVLSPGSGVPAGSVTFRDGSVVLGTATITVAGGKAQAVLNTNTRMMGVGSRGITATYTGNASFKSATSKVLSLPISKATTKTVLTLSPPAQAVAGQPVTFRAAVGVVAPGNDVVKGTVKFSDRGSVLGEITIDASGIATMTVSRLPVGTHTITAEYSGNDNLLESRSAPGSLSVARAKTKTVLATPGALYKVGQFVTLRATVTTLQPSPDPPSGTVDFIEGNTTLGSSQIAIVAGQAVATFSMATLTARAHLIKAVYRGNSGLEASDSSAILVTVTNSSTPSATRTRLTTSASSSVVGQSVSLTATVDVPAHVGVLPSGTVSFMEGTTTLFTGPLEVVNGVSSVRMTTAALTLGSHRIVAVYKGITSFSTSESAAMTQTVRQATTRTEVTSSSPEAVAGSMIRFSATVAVVSPGSGRPTGTVSFYRSGTMMGTGTLAEVNGKIVASFSTNTIPPGTYSITAIYAGDQKFQTSTSTTLQQVVVPVNSPASTRTTLTTSSPSVVFGQSLTLTARVSVISPRTGIPSGTVTFRDGEVVLGTATLSVVSGVATAKLTLTTPIAVGSHRLTATYNGVTTFTTSTSEETVQSILKASTRLVLTTTTISPVSGQTIELLATLSVVAPGGGIPTGKVTFRKGSAVLGQGTLSVSGNQIVARLSVSGQLVGTHAISAVYEGSDSYVTSSPANLSLVIRKADASITITSSAPTAVSGAPVTLTASLAVVSPGSGSPGGTVTFKDGTKVLGTANLVLENGRKVARLVTSGLTVGSHSITAVYSGDSDFNGATSASFNQVITAGSGLFDGNYTGEFSGTATADGFRFSIPGPVIAPGDNTISVSVVNNQATIRLPGIGGGGSGTIAANGQFSISTTGGRVAGLGVNVTFSGTLRRNTDGSVSGSGTWTIENSPGVTGSGTWTVRRISPA